MRGAITKEIRDRSEELLGYDIGATELRLMAYVQYVMVNHQYLERQKLGTDDRIILARWREMGHIEGGTGGLSITKKFWDAMCEILWMGYVVHGDQPR